MNDSQTLWVKQFVTKSVVSKLTMLFLKIITHRELPTDTVKCKSTLLSVCCRNSRPRRRRLTKKAVRMWEAVCTFLFLLLISQIGQPSFQ